MDGKEYAAALRTIADWYEAHPTMPFTLCLGVGNVTETKEAAEQVAHALAPCRKRYLDDFFMLSRDFGGIELQFVFHRATVCERVVVGHTEIPETLVPAHTQEQVEWRCVPLFREGG